MTIILNQHDCHIKMGRKQLKYKYEIILNGNLYLSFFYIKLLLRKIFIKVDKNYFCKE